MGSLRGPPHWCGDRPPRPPPRGPGGTPPPARPTHRPPRAVPAHRRPPSPRSLRDTRRRSSRGCCSSSRPPSHTPSPAARTRPRLEQTGRREGGLAHPREPEPERGENLTGVPEIRAPGAARPRRPRRLCGRGLPRPQAQGRASRAQMGHVGAGLAVGGQQRVAWGSGGDPTSPACVCIS